MIALNSMNDAIMLLTISIGRTAHFFSAIKINDDSSFRGLILIRLWRLSLDKHLNVKQAKERSDTFSEASKNTGLRSNQLPCKSIGQQSLQVGTEGLELGVLSHSSQRCINAGYLEVSMWNRFASQYLCWALARENELPRLKDLPLPDSTFRLHVRKSMVPYPLPCWCFLYAPLAEIDVILLWFEMCTCHIFRVLGMLARIAWYALHWLLQEPEKKKDVKKDDCC
jgi:hypothetical protein